MALFHRARHEDLASKLERKGSQLSQMAAEKGSESSRRVADILRRASEDIRSSEMSDYKERAMAAMGTARERAEERAENARDKIRTHPLASVTVAMGLGIVAGAAVAVAASRMASKYEY
jgi:ElaB/YqjD/DUF883 family membrane-anchored ribosome-binding protein